MNKGLRALKKASPEAYAKIMGNKAMYGMKIMSEGGVAQKSLYQTVKNENEMSRKKADLEARIEAARGTDAAKGLVEEYRALTDTAALGAKLMSTDKKGFSKMAAKGMKILKEYFSGGVVPHAVYNPIGMQAQQRAGMQNFVTAAANAEIDKDRKEEKVKTPKPEDMKEMNSITIAEVPGAMDNDGLRAMGAAPGLLTGGPSAGPATMTIPRSGTGGSGMGQLGMGDGVKVMKDGGLYADNGKKNGEDEEENVSSSEALRRMAEANPGRLVFGSTADTARPKENLLGQPMGFTTAVESTAVPIQGIVIPPGMQEEVPSDTITPRPPARMNPMRTLKVGLPQQRVPRELMGGIREIQTPEGPKYTFDFRGTSTYGGTPDSGHVAGSGSGGSSYDPSRAGQIGGLQAFGYEDGKRLGEGEMMGGRTGSSYFYLPGATGVPLYQDSPVNLMGSSSPILADIENMQSMDTGKYRNITDIYDLYGEDAYMSALGELQKQGIDIDKFDLPIEFDRPSMFDPNSPGLLAGLGKTSSDVVRSRASRSVDGRVVSGTGELGAPAFMGGTGKRATEGSGGREQRELIKYFQRKAEQAAEEFGPNSKEAKQFEDLIAQNLGAGGRLYMQGGKMYGTGGMRPIKNYGHGGRNC